MAQDSRTGRAEGWRTWCSVASTPPPSSSDVVAQKLGAAADPRAKLLRKRRWALRAGWFFTFSSAFWVGVTVLLASWSHPRVGAADPVADRCGGCISRHAVVATLPLAQGHAAAAGTHCQTATAVGIGGPRSPWRRWRRPSGDWFSLLGVMERGQMLPDDELREVASAANQTAATMTATARRGGVDGAGRQRGSAIAVPTWRPPSARSSPSWIVGRDSTTKWSPPQRNWCRRPTPGRCRVRRCRRSATGTNLPTPPIG